MSIQLHHGSILDFDVDAIVNAANTTLQLGGGLAGAIAIAGGSSIQEECDAIGWCDLGSAAATRAGRLRARYVIHVPTVDYTRGKRASLEKVERGARAALELARSLSVSTIALPLLGAGIAGLKPADVVRVMKRAMAGFDDLHITVCVHWRGDWPAVQQAFQAA